ncbi:MAG: beta strand repeat-containing protein [Burkholderiales bacterium]
MKSMKSNTCGAVVMAGLLLAACGGGGGGVVDLSQAAAPVYSIGGTVSGLGAGKNIVLRNNGGNDLTVGANGAFTFSGTLNNNEAYSVTIATQPVGQICTVGTASGTVRGANVTTVAVSCTSNAYTIGGTVSGLVAGRTVVLRNNGANDLTATANVGFTFSTALLSGATYSVTVATQPVAQTCSVGNASGTVVGANIANVTVTCGTVAPGAPTVTLGFGVKELRFSWPAVGGATHYRVFESPEIGSGYTQLGPDLTLLVATMNFNHAIPVHRRLGARYYVEACNAIGCTRSAIRTLTTADLTLAIGYVKASIPAAGALFGTSVAVSGDGNTLAVGAIGEGGGVKVGAVYVFTRNATTSVWSEQQIVRASNAGADDLFGKSVALSNDGSTLAVGAPSEDGSTASTAAAPDNLTANAGAAYVFTRNGAGAWTQQAYVKASNAGVDDAFGTSVALSTSGDTLAVGAPSEDGSAASTTALPNDLAPNAGAAYVFTRSGTAWTQQAYVKALNAGSDDAFGVSVALSSDGNTLAVGAIGEDTSAANAGAVYVFTRSGAPATWTQQALVKPTNAGIDDAFGTSVALSSDGATLAVGAISEDGSTTSTSVTPNNDTANAGAVYVFTRSGTPATWTQQAYMKASNARVDDAFGTSVALSGNGNTLAVGAIGEDSSTFGIGGALTGTASNAGAVYVFTRTGTTWTEKSTVKASNTGSDDGFGLAVALSSDGNTLAVGAIGEDGNGAGGPTNNSAGAAGAVYLY